jgi:hypothetical protein
MSINATLVRTAFAAAAIALSGCALDPQGGYRPATQFSGSSQQPISFDEANAQCWTVSMNNAGYGASMAQLQAYQTCMARNGWQDQRTLF